MAKVSPTLKSWKRPVSIPRQRGKPLDYYLLLLAGDVFFFLIAFILACLVRDGISRLFSGLPEFYFMQDFPPLLKRCWIFLPVFVFLAFRRAYDRRLPFWEETREILASLFWGVVAVYALVSLKKLQPEISRLVVGFTGVFSMFLLPFGRFYSKCFLFSFKRYSSVALIFGAGRTGRCLAQALHQEKYLGYRVVGFLDDNPSLYGRIFEGLKVYGPIRQVGKFVRLMNVEAIFIAGTSFSPKRLAEIYALSQRLVREIYVVPEFYGLGILNAELSCLFSRQLFVLRIRNNLILPLNRFFKRVFDLVLIMLSLPVILPFMGIIALLIKIDSPGPVFFRHKRLGENGRPFYIFKFRTMHPEAERLLTDYLCHDPRAAYEWFVYRKLRPDPRVTRIGKFLRKFSLDELPQIFNVLKGEMSLIGPRPITEEECRLYYGNRASFYFSVKPGLTGLWQVSGRNLLSFEERVRLDVWYVLNWSLWLDLVILVRTVGTVISQRGSF